MAYQAMQLVYKGIESMQELQAGTARAHEKFLETQTAASQALQEMMQQTRMFADTVTANHPEPHFPEPGNRSYSNVEDHALNQTPDVSAMPQQWNAASMPDDAPFPGADGTGKNGRNFQGQSLQDQGQSLQERNAVAPERVAPADPAQSRMTQSKETDPTAMASRENSPGTCPGLLLKKITLKSHR